MTNYSCFARCPVRLESFCLGRESFRPQYEVILRGLRVHTYTYVCGPAPFFRTRNIYATFLPVNCQTHHKFNQKKILNLTCFSLFLDPVVTCTYHVVWEFIWEKKLCFSGGWHGDLMVSVLNSGGSRPVLCPGPEHCVVFLGKTLYSHSASLYPGVSVGTSDLLGKPNKLHGSDMWRISLASCTGE